MKKEERGSDGYLKTTPNGLIYNSPFKVIGVEMEDITHEYAGLYYLEFMNENGDSIFYTVKDFHEWTRLKLKLSNMYFKFLSEFSSNQGSGRINYKDPKRFIIKYMFNDIPGEVVIR